MQPLDQNCSSYLCVELTVFMLFTGSGLGSLLFGKALQLGLGVALTLFAAAEFALVLAAIRLLNVEEPPTADTSGGNRAAQPSTHVP